MLGLECSINWAKIGAEWAFRALNVVILCILWLFPQALIKKGKFISKMFAGIQGKSLPLPS